MNKLLFSLIIFMALLSACKNGIKEDETQIRNDKVYKINSDQPYTGKVLTDNNGFTTYKDGLKDGETKLFYKNGQQREESVYQKGNPEGILRKWAENGAKIGDTLIYYSKLSALGKINGTWYGADYLGSPRIFFLTNSGEGYCTKPFRKDYSSYVTLEDFASYNFTILAIYRSFVEVKYVEGAYMCREFSGITKKFTHLNNLNINVISYDQITIDGVLFNRLYLDDNYLSQLYFSKR